MIGTILNIFISENAGDSIINIKKASLVAGKGIKGDRYYNQTGTFSKKLKGNPAVELTLIEKEEIDKFNNEQNLSLNYSEFRRNVLTEGISLNSMVGKIFCIGEIKLKGIKLCEPCSHLAETANNLVIPHLIGRGGLRAQIITSGEIAVGQNIKG